MNADGSAEGLLTGQEGLDGEHRFQLGLLTAFARALEEGEDMRPSMKSSTR